VGEGMKRLLWMGLTVIFAVSVYAVPAFADTRELEDEIVYEIIVDRFNNGNYEIDEDVDIDNPKMYHGGDLEGITKKLDDLENIGVTTIALSPIMTNADNGYHGYWIVDFMDINKHFGTFEDLEQLVSEAHSRDIKVVLEFVTNYISEAHPIAMDTNKTDWIRSDSVEGPEWTDAVVELNQDHPEVQAYLLEAASFWLEETDIDGFVLQAVEQSSVDFLESFTKTLKDQYNDIYLLGDVYGNLDNMSELLEKTAFDAIDNDELSNLISDVFSEPEQPVSQIYEASEAADELSSLVFVDDKYSKRFTQKFSENRRNTLTAWTLALTYMYTTPGTPIILQGSEVGMYGEDAEDSQRLVPFISGEPELKEFHDRISSLRGEFAALRKGDFEIVDSSDAMAVFKRTYEDQTMFIAINNGTESDYVDVKNVESGKMLRGYLEDNIIRENEEGNYRIGIPRESVEVYEVVDNEGINWVFLSLVIGVMAVFIVGVVFLTVKQKQK